MKEFPSFDCLITGTTLGYDHDVELYFSTEKHLASVLSALRFEDPEWREFYQWAIGYLDALGKYLVGKGPLPDPSHLVKLAREGNYDYSYQALLTCDNPAVPKLGEASALALNLMHLFAKLGKEEGFKEKFNPAAFAGLPYLEEVLWKRALRLSS
ncbi:hypothetical protein HS1genome_1527 [Sulfodiicoccus acidiphilus]|uniref:Uncharacterized protein n=1 Tax=Sulfodiicoccus acidiphilus TaxID=1670455 RepID=A0A348B4N6_9CREN|nr:hypothetical protein [Sulfodiicoccus acidiphilus]BBD73138.1 hypothetical protein HS1genome_1527 [Sulfodiicoccus acidiphilus]GGU00542.1 hypothetical protein GCM10007116_17220 [Sulfodiicoccus acidiphilus]